MDETGPASGHLMLITPERVFYAGLLGRPRARCSGAFHVYVAIRDGLWLSSADGREAYGELLAVAPNVRHTVTSDHRSVICVTVEPESVSPGALDELMTRLLGEQRELYARRIRAAYDELRSRACRGDITSSAFDRMCFDEALPRRRLDARVARAIAQIGRFSGEPVTATSCANEAGLSASRFLHLFKQETGMAFRAFRAWKRARSLLRYVRQAGTLTDIALDTGYPDSTHFSHSIRQVYGLKPSDIVAGSRRLVLHDAAGGSGGFTRQ